MSGRANAQTCASPSSGPVTGCAFTSTGTLTVNTAASMSLSGAITGVVTTLGAPGAADFAAGSKVTAGPRLTVKANTQVHVTIAASEASWRRNGTLTVAKNANQLAWGAALAGPFTPVTTGTGATVLSTAASDGTASFLDLFYRMQLSYTTDVPGTWTLPLVFTLTAP